MEIKPRVRMLLKTRYISRYISVSANDIGSLWFSSDKRYLVGFIYDDLNVCSSIEEDV